MQTNVTATLSHACLEAELATLAAQIDAVEHRFLTLVREIDRRQLCRAAGLATTASWLGWKVGLGVGAAREKVRVANALGALPLIDASLAKGEVSYSKVRAMTRCATPENEAKLLRMANQASAAQLERICRGVVQVTSARSNGPKERWVRIDAAPDGMVRSRHAYMPTRRRCS